MDLEVQSPELSYVCPMSLLFIKDYHQTTISTLLELVVTIYALSVRMLLKQLNIHIFLVCSNARLFWSQLAIDPSITTRQTLILPVGYWSFHFCLWSIWITCNHNLHNNAKIPISIPMTVKKAIEYILLVADALSITNEIALHVIWHLPTWATINSMRMVRHHVL